MRALSRAELLGPRALNRATLARQLLLDPSELPVLDAVEHLVGLQAQIPLNPYVGLWARLRGFRPDELGDLLMQRRVVRIVAMRATIHLLSADDCLVLRPLMQPVLDAELARHRDYAPALTGVDIASVLDYARPLLAERAHTGSELRAALAARFPQHDAAALAYACRNGLAFVQVPPRGVWGQAAQVTSTTAEAWLGRPLATAPSLDRVVLRYLAAFGPATPADVGAWSRLSGMREVVDRLRPQLRTFRDDAGRELFDLPDAPRPTDDVPAPTRFLPEYDNLLLSHADRRRVVSDEHRARLSRASGRVQGSVLHDGVLCGVWRVDREQAAGPATLVVQHVGRLTKRAAAAVTAEGHRLLDLVAADAGGQNVRLGRID